VTLDDKDIIQVDATIIIGVLILLTLSLRFSIPEFGQLGANMTQDVRFLELQARSLALEWSRTLITWVVITPFTVSAMLVIIHNMLKKPNKPTKWGLLGLYIDDPLIKLAMAAMLFGFVSIIFAISLIVWYQWTSLIEVIT
jgi:hypothetical protein